MQLNSLIDDIKRTESDIQFNNSFSKLWSAIDIDYISEWWILP